ncbi:MAG: PTS sugar transporter subunit IIB [Erysipelotrichaceae bacterium]|nr:PTS sugar transporter subunit IIB [Erysipelotrichaceae bacterium]
MRKIVLLCAAGMSTSLLVNKMKEYAASIGYEADIAAYPVAEAEQRGADADVVLLGPQVKFSLKKVQGIVKCPCEAIEMRAYGMMDGKAVVEFAKKLIGD